MLQDLIVSSGVYTPIMCDVALSQSVTFAPPQHLWCCWRSNPKINGVYPTPSIYGTDAKLSPKLRALYKTQHTNSLIINRDGNKTTMLK